MHKLLVPIEDFSGPSLWATYFAIEFARRNPAKLFFLIFSKAEGGRPDFRTSPAAEKEGDLLKKQFDDLLQRARAEKINLEIFYSNEGFQETTSQFSRDHGLTEIIIALPSEGDPEYPRLVEQVDQLRHNLERQLIIVKPKEEKMVKDKKLKVEENPPSAVKPKPQTGRKGA